MKTPIKKKVAEANNVDTTRYKYSLLVDGNNLLKISLVNKELNDKGLDCGGVVMFLHQLGKVLQKKDFDYCTVCWDGEGSGFLRWKLYPDYKANRDKKYALYDPNITPEYKLQLLQEKVLLDKLKSKMETEDDDVCFKRQKSIIQRILDELCIRQFEFNIVEGDDIISNYVKNKPLEEKVVILSGDKDITQLISPTVVIYNPNKKDFITESNSVKMLGVRHDNVVLEKMLCGDSSDNIKGVKGLGEATLHKLIPEFMTEKIGLDYVLNKVNELQGERKTLKKKPLVVLDNILNGTTMGVQGDKLYEVNKAIIDLSEPLLTDEAKNTMDEECYAPIDTSDRNVKNVYAIFTENHMYNLLNENRFGDILAPFSRIISQENRRFAKNC